MSARKSERLLNLLITLLVSRTYLTKAQIRELIEPYRTASYEAFEKMFERDKDELRALGIPIEVGSQDSLFEDSVGYRIPRRSYELPDITLTPEEAAVVGIASRVWQHAGLAASAGDAIRKLQAAGLDTDVTSLDVALPQLPVTEPSFDALWDATISRTPVTFDYRSGTGSEVERRHLQPWGMAMAKGRWYCVGFDGDRGERRVFRLSRIIGAVTVLKGQPTYDVPGDFNLREAMEALSPTPGSRTASLRVRPGSAQALRARARAVSGGAEWDSLEVEFGRTAALVDELLEYGPDVVVEGPDDVRRAVITRLEALAR